MLDNATVTPAVWTALSKIGGQRLSTDLVAAHDEVVGL